MNSKGLILGNPAIVREEKMMRKKRKSGRKPARRMTLTILTNREHELFVEVGHHEVLLPGRMCGALKAGDTISVKVTHELEIVPGSLR